MNIKESRRDFIKFTVFAAAAAALPACTPTGPAAPSTEENQGQITVSTLKVPCFPASEQDAQNPRTLVERLYAPEIAAYRSKYGENGVQGYVDGLYRLFSRDNSGFVASPSAGVRICAPKAE